MAPLQLLALAAAVALLVVLVVSVVRTVRNDGYATRPLPRSHPEWSDLPFRGL